MRLLAFSDLHLDAPFANGGAESAAHRRAHLREALTEIVRLAHEMAPDALVCAGDLYEHERFTPDTDALLHRLFAELQPLPVLLAPGNHDWYGPTGIHATGWTPNVHVFTTSSLTPWDGLDGVRVWGAAHLAPSGTSGFLDHFSVEGTALHVGLFHGSELGGWAREDASKVQHAPFRAEQVREAGLAHAVVGHHHRRVEGATHTYPGCPVPLAHGDPGDGGAVMLELAAGGELASRTWYRVSRLDAHDLVVSLDGLDDLSAVEQHLDDALEGRSGVARVTLEGELAPSLDLDLDLLAARRGALLELVVRTGRITTGYDLDAIAEERTVRGQFVRDVLSSDLDPDRQQRVVITGLRALEGRDDLEVA
jgi:exonuclease SbcD